MISRLTMSAFAAVVAAIGVAGPALAEPAASTVYTFGKCFDPGQPPLQRPATFAYNCDNTGVMENMTWTAWDAGGAQGTGTDTAVECQPNCAQGEKVTNPIVVHAWNPLPAGTPGCPTGVEFYSDLTIAYPKGVPPWIKPGTTWSPGTDFVTIDGMPAVHYSGFAPNCLPAPGLY